MQFYRTIASAFGMSTLMASEEFIGSVIERKILGELPDGTITQPFYRIESIPFYGGCITAVGCIMRCIYCWNYNRNAHPEGIGIQYSPKDLANKMWKMGIEHNCSRFRMSGAETILGDLSYVFLIELIDEIKKKGDFEFIIETNGIFLGQSEELCKIFIDPRIQIQISLKASNPEMFLKITGLEQRYFQNQLNAIEYLKSSGVNFSVAILDFIPIEDIENLGITVNEVEKLRYYAGVKQRMDCMLHI